LPESIDPYRVFASRLLGSVMDASATVLEIREGRIASVRAPKPGEVPGPLDVDARDLLVAPGLVDTHVHGGFGLDQMDGNEETIRRHAALLPSRGVTAFLVTPLTAPWPSITAAVRAAATVRKRPSEGALVLGCHLEGPFLNPQYKGAQNADHLCAPNFVEMEAALGELMGELRIVTLAPELPGALDTCRRLVDAGIRVSVGHSAATYDQVSAAIDAGASRATHCFNAMRGLHHREPGVAGAALTRSELAAELIWDDIHVHPVACRLLCEAKGSRGVIAVSDGTTGVGMQDGYRFDLWGLPATVASGAARLSDGTLAGSTIALDDALRNAAREVGLERAVNLCCTAPAASLGLEEEMGVLAPGRRADFVLLKPDLSVKATYTAGLGVFASS